MVMGKKNPLRVWQGGLGSDRIGWGEAWQLWWACDLTGQAEFAQVVFDRHLPGHIRPTKVQVQDRCLTEKTE